MLEEFGGTKQYMKKWLFYFFWMNMHEDSNNFGFSRQRYEVVALD